MEQSSPDTQNINKQLVITHEAQQFLISAANWAKFLAILGFGAVFVVAMGTYIITLLMTNVSNMPEQSRSDIFMTGSFLSITSIIMTILYFYALFKILKFSNTLKWAIKTNNSEALTKAFQYLKSHYKSMGIMMITGLILYTMMAIGMGFFILYGMATLVETF